MSTNEKQGFILQKRLILASGSRYRQQQLQQLNLPFQAISPDIDESHRINEAAESLALRLAESKARVLAQKITEHALIIGSDQTASCDGRLLGKPGTESGAIEQLSFCQGKTVIFYTALALLDTESKQMLADTVSTKVKFRPLSREQIARYIKKEQPLDCAGSFKCEGLGIALFESIDSNDPTALIGLPLIRLTTFLQQLGVQPI
ncbi:Maf family protein [Teredinibacter haidensis]|uniref:Maf family protein n=1 Tax=Teredinibacter haidensis TaxID=2731755 RepID=UPI000949076E|nr:nucleoside triphosphate pyrophosphatase [Teredinibacter haidensis]